MEKEKLIEIYGLRKYFPVRESLYDLFAKREKKYVKAVNGITLAIRKGEIFGIAGESGCGKTTTAKLMARLHKPDRGKILFDGIDITRMEGRELFQYREVCQMIFQDPYESLNPRLRIYHQICEALINLKIGPRFQYREKVRAVLEMVDLDADQYVDRYPHQLSGGERQRVSIACALVANPKVLIADEPTSMLDVSIKADILRIIRRLTDEMGMTTTYISHDLSILRSICDRIAVMYLGRIVEMGDVENVISHPAHPYTKALISAIPNPDPRTRWKGAEIFGDPPNPIDVPTGCSFHPRCPNRMEKCLQVEPPLRNLTEGNSGEHLVSCHLN